MSRWRTRLDTFVTWGIPVIIIGGFAGIILRHRYKKNKMNMVSSFHYQQALLIRKMQEASSNPNNHCIYDRNTISESNKMQQILTES